MKLGVVFPQTEIGHDPGAIRDFAQAVEDLGFDYLLAYEHVLGANPDRPGGWKGPYTHLDAFHEPFVLYAYLAAITHRLEFATGILVLPQRSTALVAKQAAQLDVLSGGRVRLGVGVGWNRVEFEGMGADFSTRGQRIEEQVEVLRRLWTEPLVTFEGRDHTLNDVGIKPMPVQRPIPIWFGGYVDAVMRRMARLGDGWMPNVMPPEQGKPIIETLRGYIEQAGRDPDAFGLDVRVKVNSQPQHEWRKYAAGWRDLGATHICLNTMNAQYNTVQEHIAAVQRFKDVLSDFQG